MKRRDFLKYAAVGAAAGVPLQVGLGEQKGKRRGMKPNVLLLMVDDHNDWFAPGQTTPAQTPHLKRWSERMVAFLRAYCAAPACGPSRASLLTGVAPHRSGVYYNNQAYRKSDTWIADVENLPQRFRAAGYLTASFGKIVHSSHQQHDAHCWDPGYYEPQSHQADVALAEHTSDTVTTKIGMFKWGKLPDSWDRDDPKRMQQDTLRVEDFKRLLSRKHDKPWFCGLGIYRPHLHWYVPKRYFDLYPLDKIEVPEGFREDDLEDVPACARWLAMRRGFHRELTKRDLWKPAIQAYLAAITYADEMIGRALDALEASEYADNTVVIVCSDNGWHVGEKYHWSKFALWEKACRVPMLARVPGVSPEGVVCGEPVSLLDIYPTLVSLCGIDKPKGHELDGVDISSVLRDPTAKRGRPVLTTHGAGCHAVRNERYRYIRYRNGDEELYDVDEDPHEWTNRTGDVALADVKAQLARFIPTENAPNVPIQGKESDKGWDTSVFEKGFDYPTRPQ